MDGLQEISQLLQAALTLTLDDDPLHDCGRSCTDIVEKHPQDMLEFAYQKLNCWPFADSPACWRRLYEEASLYKALRITQCVTRPHALSPARAPKRRRLETDVDDAYISELVSVLDKAVIISGAPCRLDTIQHVFELLQGLDLEGPNPPSSFPIQLRDHIDAGEGHVISVAPERLAFAAFQEHLDNSAAPIIIPGLASEWPAFVHWKDPRFWLQLTLGGRRLIPVEIGRSYTDDDWGQQLMSFGGFLDDHLLSCTPYPPGYLAQYDLFQQFPTLRDDIVVPDYCYSTPPDANSDAVKTAGLSLVAQLYEPMINVWFGPKSTKTPLHTDPYHNILCQVVGYKYVRLYPPSETSRLYPRGVDDRGINMENTSRIDVDLVRPDVGSEEKGKTKIKRAFPLFEEAQYREAILEPGKCLYIPLGWWHYVESLSTSFSVSFWWN